MALNDLLKKNLKFILFGGKGGVGKTTMAAASAIRFARQYPKKKILIFTTDPAPSLGDSLEQNLSNQPRAIEGVKNLYAMEIDAKQVLKEFKEKYGEKKLRLFLTGDYFFF